MILVEGHTEKYLFEVFKRKSKKMKDIYQAKVHVVCLANENHERFKNKLRVNHTKRNVHVLVIVDVDKFSNAKDFALFLRNLRYLNEHKNTKTLTLIMQERFEIELSRSLKISQDELFKSFNVRSKTDFTNVFLRTDTDALYSKLGILEDSSLWQNKHIRLDDYQLNRVKEIVKDLDVGIFK